MWKYLADTNLIYVYEYLRNVQNIKSDARTLSTKPNFSYICNDSIFYYSSDDRSAGLGANNVVVTA
jgi:hypothetical protein